MTPESENRPESENDEDEQLVARLLLSIKRDAAPADRDRLDRLRDDSAQEFVAAGKSSGTSESQSQQSLFVASRALAAAAALTLLLLAYWILGPARTASSGPLGQVLEQFAQTESLHLKLTHAGQSSEIWTRQPHRLRWNLEDGTYKIADEKRLWHIDERSNRATSEPSPYFGAGSPGIDLFELLPLPGDKEDDRIRDCKPVLRAQRGGALCDVYRVDFLALEAPVRLEAAVDVNSRMLRQVLSQRQQDGQWETVTQLDVLAINAPVGDDKFVVAETLTEDGRIGKVVDAQGIVSLKPVMQQRWTPVCSRLVLKPGDWLRTDARGANAVALQLVPQNQLTLGPGTLVELQSPQRLRLLAGELQVRAADSSSLELLGPGSQKISVQGTQLFRLDPRQQQLVRLERDPRWFEGFQGSTSQESIGSLLAKVDGRNVPLTVGYHKVSVDIRDQISRTVIEESFVNHTDGQLEGVFYFPLPQDASISGFGMWVGDELVEADIVEKQRAREIYETILRERRDPALLEWTGGNLFKARVFPIPANAEKRIRISYTQVLPMRGASYRYSYALHSELLRQHPLRELAIDVTVSSVLPLRSVTSPTHTTRSEMTTHSAHVEFSAQDYTPTSDFEVVVQTEGRAGEAVLIPHRRGDDGYFMLLVTPPEAGGEWQREVLPDGEAQRLLILADTSASMDTRSRETQAAFVAALLSGLTTSDSFNLAVCDVDCQWAFAQPRLAEPQSIDAARQFLAGRRSLGWTDLDKAFESAMAQTAPGTHLIYVGDGITTTGDADPVDLARRLKLIYRGPQSEAGETPDRGTCHAVSVTSSYEPQVLKAIAALGRGSWLQVTGQTGPQQVALDLFRQIVQPGLRDFKVQFAGIQTARVYPEQLPNLAAGSQQILLGRYRPTGNNQTGAVVVSGFQGRSPVRFSTPVSLADAEAGNSFIPRLWARMHLDALLEQSVSESIREEIIALSEEYHIITPYTSMLVLESDSDRERFKVKRRFQMRDGEKFFAAGEQQARYELLQQQMKRAENWRVGLRRIVLADLASLGRNLDALKSAVVSYVPRESLMDWRVSSWWEFRGAGFGGGFGGAGFGGGFFGGAAGGMGGMLGGAFDVDEWSGGEPESDRELEEEGAVAPTGDGEADEMLQEFEQPGVELGKKMDLRSGSELLLTDRLADSLVAGAERLIAVPPTSGPWGETAFGILPDSVRWNIDELFPPVPFPASLATGEPPAPWPDDARRLSQSLLRLDKLRETEAGIELQRRTESFDSRRDTLKSRTVQVEIVSPASWLVRSGGDGSATTLQWCNADERGILSLAFLLGRIRKAAPDEVHAPPLGLGDHSLAAIEDHFRGYTAAVQHENEEHDTLILTPRREAATEIRVLVDTSRHVIERIERRSKGMTTSATKFSEFVEVAGCWWATRMETTDAEGKRTSLVSQSIRSLTAEETAARLQQELAVRDRSQLIRQPLPSLPSAKGAVAAEKGTFDDHLTLMLHFAATQRWNRVDEQLARCAQLAAGKSGARWLNDVVLRMSRRHEQLKQRLFNEADRLRDAPGEDDLYLAQFLERQADDILAANEVLALLDRLRPVFERQEPHMQAMKTWLQYRSSWLESAGDRDAALSVRRQLAVDYPRDSAGQQQYAQALAANGEYESAYAWIASAMTNETEWHPHEVQSLRNTYASLLERQGQYAEVANYLAEWVSRNLPDEDLYNRYLAALFLSGQVDEANSLIGKWLTAGRGQPPGEMPADVQSRLRAAVSHALGQGYHLYTNQIDDRWLDLLAQTLLELSDHEAGLSTANRIMHSNRFQESDQCRRVRRTVLDTLESQIDRLTPAQIDSYVSWNMPSGAAVERGEWQQIADKLQQRWTVETDDDTRNKLAAPLILILTHRIDDAALLRFLAVQRDEGPAKYRIRYTRQLFKQLVAQSWNSEHEQAAFELLDKLSDSGDPATRLLEQVLTLHELTDAMAARRYEAAMKSVEHQERLTRIEMRKLQREKRSFARAGMADQLAQQSRRQMYSPELARWIKIEQLYWATLADGDLGKIAEECWKLLGDDPPPARDREAEPDAAEWLEIAYRERLLTMLLNLAVRRGAAPEQVTRLVAYLDRAQLMDPQNDAWKQFDFELLVALDRPDELEANLRRWIRLGDPANRWRRTLGYLLAETGGLEAAITLFEAVEAEDELAPADYRALAGWYMAVDRRQDHERALIDTYRTLDEWDLDQAISQELDRWTQDESNLPRELDEDVLHWFAALFAKSSDPESYLWQLRELYQACRDFRLLAVLADAVVGHTAQKIYPFLEDVQPVLEEVRDEATADAVVERIEAVRARGATALDQRALDLLEVMVQRRAAELLNQPGPHVDRARIALERAFRREWSAGEPRPMADFLAALGRITSQEIAAVQLGQLAQLEQQVPAGTLDRLHIAHRRAQALWSYERHDEAINLLESSIQQHQQASGGALPANANGPMASYLSYLKQRGRFAHGENVLLAEITRPANRRQLLWLSQQLDELYVDAIHAGGEVSLGSGRTLYQALEKRIRRELSTDDPWHRYALFGILCRAYRAANSRQFPGVAADLKAFAAREFPVLIKNLTDDYQSAVSLVAASLHDIGGAAAGVEFLVQQFEVEPAWLRYRGRDSWSQHGGTLSSWTAEAKELPADLENRLLKIVVQELKRDLASRQQRARFFYDASRPNGHFWSKQEGAFSAAAEEVLAVRKQSGESALYVAQYLYTGLDRHARAIEILLEAQNAGRLDESGQAQLAKYLQDQRRFADSVAVLQPLVQLAPDQIDYRVRLMRAYFVTQRQAELLELLVQTDQHFHQRDLWGEKTLLALAGSCLENELYEQSVSYYNELIPLYKQTHAFTADGDSTLAKHYSDLALAYKALKKTAEAVDAAANAIASWGDDQENRALALFTLESVLMGADDVEQFVRQLDEQTAESGLDSPIIRKALGHVYLDRNQPEDAIAQLELAAQLQPNDGEIYDLLVSCYDRKGDSLGGAEQMLRKLEMSRRDIELCQKLGDRFQELGNDAEQERAYTSIVELLPSESESHAALAEIREGQDRWAEAIEQWRQVVRIRSLEPTGLVRLAKAQLHEKLWDEAALTVRELTSREWSPFDSVDDEIRQLQQSLQERQ